jgi:hypothetical protein
MDTEKWREKVKRTLKAELKRKGVSYDELVKRLADMGISESTANIRVKMSRGSFSAVWFFQCLEAIDVKEIKLG